jgi:UDP-N-acetylmuramoyl-L-alanyl-D-glutamate--2,6-diaminopimelate ligase
MKELIRKVVPKWAIRFYHWALAQTGAFLCGYPAKKMVVIGVTGTKGKSTTAYLIAKILEAAGNKVGLTSTIIFKVGEKEWLNDRKMTMLGRFDLQKLLKKMVSAGCKYAVVETSSEGIAQYRHIGIDYDIAVFTNLSPEHIESHGSYDRYRAAKGKLFQSLYYGKNKGVPKTAIVNIDDAEADYFLSFNENNIGFTLKNAYKEKAKEIISVKNISVSDGGSSFAIGDTAFSTKLLGDFNVYNLAGAVAAAKICGVPAEIAQKAVAEIKNVPGRMEFIEEGQSFKVIVDYAHEPASMKALYSIVREIPHKRVIHIFGAAGGGRDRARRPILGEIADQNAQIIILTDDDPYAESESKIIDDIRRGIMKKKENENLFIVPDRKRAIEAGMGFAQENDLVLITGKGCEQKMAIGGKMIPWDDREAARGAIKNLKI